MNSLFLCGMRRYSPRPRSTFVAAALLASLAIGSCTLHEKGHTPQSAWIAGWMAAPSWRPQNPLQNEMTAYSNQSVRQDVRIGLRVAGGPEMPDSALPQVRGPAIVSAIEIAAAPAAKPAVIVAFGDSITEGAGSHTPHVDWPSLLAQRLQQSCPGGFVVLNAGISGNRLLGDGGSPGGLSRLDRDALSVTQVACDPSCRAATGFIPEHVGMQPWRKQFPLHCLVPASAYRADAHRYAGHEWVEIESNSTTSPCGGSERRSVGEGPT